ncbi:MAG: LPS export ABC transporter permease LptG [Gammaproteobacteria bacterium]
MVLERYIGKTIIGTILIVILVLAGVEIFIEFTHEFPDIGTGSYGWLQVLRYVPLMLPEDIYHLFPMAGLLGSLIGLGLLSSNSELVVMRASGMSLLQVTQAVLKAALLLTLFMLLVGEVLGPIAQHHAMENKATAISGGQTLLTTQGVWVHNQDNFIHIDTVLPDGHWKAVLRYQVNSDKRLSTVSFADEGFYDDQQKWIFKNVKETRFKDDKTEVENFPEQTWNLTLSPRLLGVVTIDAEQKSLFQLYNYISDRKKLGLNVDRYKFTFWQRALEPLAILVMIFLSVPFIFGFLRYQTMGLRIVTGTAFGFSFYVLNQFIGPFTMLYRMPAFFAALLPILIFAGLGYALLRRVK